MDLSLFLFFAMNVAAASTGGIFSPGSWYERLQKPSWRPPNFLFGPVWVVLYIMITIAGWRVWQASTPEDWLLPMSVYGVHLIFNTAWSAVFFGLRRPDLALIDMALLWLSIVATIAVFAPIDSVGAWLLVPYLVWVSFAFSLNVEIWRLNRGALA